MLSENCEIFGATECQDSEAWGKINRKDFGIRIVGINRPAVEALSCRGARRARSCSQVRKEPRHWHLLRTRHVAKLAVPRSTAVGWTPHGFARRRLVDAFCE